MASQSTNLAGAAGVALVRDYPSPTLARAAEVALVKDYPSTTLAGTAKAAGAAGVTLVKDYPSTTLHGTAKAAEAAGAAGVALVRDYPSPTLAGAAGVALAKDYQSPTLHTLHDSLMLSLEEVKEEKYYKLIMKLLSKHDYKYEIEPGYMDVSRKLSQKEIIYHHSVGECSILSVNAPLYILVKEPKTTSNIYGSDPIRTPLNIGYNLTDILTPNLYSKKFIDNIIQDSSKYKNPFTNEKVITYIPLTSNPSLIEEKMELVIGKCQYMNHLVNVYISIMINGLIKYPWMKDSEEIIIEHLRELIKNVTSLSVSIDNSKRLSFYEKLMSLTNKLDKLSHGEKVTIDSIIEKCFH
jgi:hypothetical protein